MFAKDEHQLIATGEGPVFTLNYDTSESCPRGCISLDPENAKVADPLDDPLAVCAFSGDVCFEICGDIYPDESSFGTDDCGDGEVDIFDVLEEIDIILGIGTHSDCQMTRGDVPNGTPPNCRDVNGEIDIFDIIVLIDVVLERENCCDYIIGNDVPPAPPDGLEILP